MSFKSIMDFSVVILLVAGTNIALATPIGPVFPPPGGVSFSQTGNSAGDPNGVTFNFANFDTSQFSKLYWGPSDRFAIQAGLDGQLHDFMFTGFTSKKAEWNSLAPLDYPFGNTAVAARFVITLTGNVSFVSAESVGLPSFLGAVVDNSSGTNFSAKLEFLGFTGQPFPDDWAPLNDFQQLPSNTPQTLTKFSGGFFHVPEPTTISLLIIGMASFLSRGFKMS